MTVRNLATVEAESSAKFGPAIDTNTLSGLFDELFPIMRSITGPGLRRSLAAFARYMPLAIEEVPTGAKVFDWEVPPEWTFRSARLIGPDGVVVADAANNTLHVVNYSVAIDCVIPRVELERHLHSIPDLPDAIPYVTSYYRRDWGFCLAHRVRQALPNGNYRVIIDADLNPGAVSIGQCKLPGECDQEILLTSYLCHPSMANNELSGPLVMLGLFDRLRRWDRRRYTYRFVLNPETIGALCFLNRHGGELGPKLAGGIVLTCLGGPQETLSYKLSRSGQSIVDRVMRGIAVGEIASRNCRVALRDFTPYGGSDERQYCSPGFDWPIGQAARTVYGEYDAYHTSRDTKDFMGVGQVEASISALEEILRFVEIGGWFENLRPYGEPQLGRRGLYPTQTSPDSMKKSNDTLEDDRDLLRKITYILNFSDRKHTMIEIAAKCACDIGAMAEAIERLEQSGLLRLSRAA